MATQAAAIFFDMDGTLLDWKTGMEESWLASCETNCDGSYEPLALHEAIKVRRTWFWDDHDRATRGRMDLNGASREIVRHAFADSGLDAHALSDAIADRYRALRLDVMALYPGAIETLAEVRRRGMRAALLTNGEARSQRHSVERFGLAPYFDCVVIEGEFGVGKPDVRVFEHALASCGVAPEQTWMVGDSLEADIAPAVALGMRAIWIPDEPGREPTDGARPHRTIAGIHELLP